jgi:hypothetical protein
LQAYQHDHYGRGSFEVERTMLATQQAGELVTDDFKELLLGSQALENLLAERFCLDRIEKVFDHLHMDVGFEES